MTYCGVDPAVTAPSGLCSTKPKTVTALNAWPASAASRKARTASSASAWLRVPSDTACWDAMRSNGVRRHQQRGRPDIGIHREPNPHRLLRDQPGGPGGWESAP
jgi:hypothetical protein